MKPRSKLRIAVTLLLGLVTVLSGYGDGSNSNAAPLTQIVVDGRVEEWVGRSVLRVDPAGDAGEGLLDFTVVGVKSCFSTSR